jgi:hypothetical protein
MQDVMGVFVGHDHDNDYIGMEHDIALAFGRVTGADAYGEFERGARVIELHEGAFRFDTWIRTPSSKAFTYYFPSGLSSVDEENMKYFQAKSVQPQKQGVAYNYYQGTFKRTNQIASATKAEEGTMRNISITGALAEDHFAYEFRTWIRNQKGVFTAFIPFRTTGRSCR